MPITWNIRTDKAPKDGDECILLAWSGLVQGPISYQDREDTNGKSIKGWLELFGPMASQEAGTFIPFDTEGVTHWALVSDFNLPELEDG